MDKAMKIWLDDQYEDRKDWFDESWTYCRWPTEVFEKIKAGGVTHVSLDHDLADSNAGVEGRKEITGYDVALWIEEQVKTNDSFIPPEISIHSRNAVGQGRMKASIRQIGVYLEQRTLEKSTETIV